MATCARPRTPTCWCRMVQIPMPRCSASWSEARRFRDDKELGEDDVAGAEHLRVSSRHGIIDIMRGGLLPLDYETVSERAETAEWNGQTVRVAALPSVVGFKRLAARPQDQVDLTELEAIHGELPIDPIPGLDS